MSDDDIRWEDVAPRALEAARLSAAVRKLRAACEAALYEVDTTAVYEKLEAALEETKEFD